MAKSRDLFDETTMSFGEHLEALRMHLWKALIGLVVCVILALFFGDDVVAVIRGPIEDALRQSRGQTEEFRLWESIKSWFGGARDDGQVTDKGLEELQKLRLKRLDLSRSGVTAEGLRKFHAASPNVELIVDSLKVPGLAALKDFGAKCELNDDYKPIALVLRDTRVNNADLKLLRGLTSLEKLDLANTAISDAGLKYLVGLSNLKVLNLTATQVSDDGVESLKSLVNLERLDLRHTEITDAGLEHLAGLKKLTSLNLYATKITDKGLKHLAGLTNLKELSVSGPEITDTGLEHLKSLKNLARLDLGGTRISDDGLVHLAGLTQLRELNFRDEPSRKRRMSDVEAMEETGREMIEVRMSASDLAAQLQKIDPKLVASVETEEDTTLLLSISAPEFAQFRSTSEKVDKPITLNVQEAFLTYLKVSFATGLIFASPWVFYQIWLFVAAGLYPHEQRYVYTFLPVSLGLFIGGVLFCFFVVFPFVLKFLLGFNQMLGVTAQIRLSEWISFAIMLPLMFGVSFQLPLVMLFLERISIFEANDYRQKRRMAILVIAVLSMLLTPADPMSMILMMIPLLGLYELGILMCVFGGHKSPFEGEAES